MRRGAELLSGDTELFAEHMKLALFFCRCAKGVEKRIGGRPWTILFAVGTLSGFLAGSDVQELPIATTRLCGVNLNGTQRIGWW